MKPKSLTGFPDKHKQKWTLVLICLVLVVASALFYQHHNQPVYQVKILASIQYPGTDNLAQGFEQEKGDSGQLARHWVQNQLSIFKSRSNILKVVNRLGLWLDYQQKGRFSSLALYNKLPIRYELLRVGSERPKELNLTIKNKTTYLIHKKHSAKAEFEFNKTYTDETGSWMIAGMPALEKYIGSHIRIQIKDPELVVTQLLSNIEIKQIDPKNHTLEISIKDQFADRGKDILNQLVSTYNVSSAVENKTSSEQAVQELDQRLSALNSTFDTLQQQMSDFKNRNGTMELSEKPRFLLNKLYANDVLLIKCEEQLNLIPTLQDLVRRDNAVESALPNISGMESPELSALFQQLSDRKTEYQHMLETHLETDSYVLPYKTEIVRIKQETADYLEKEKALLQRRQKEMLGRNEQYERSAEGLPEPEKGLLNLQRRQLDKQFIYADLLQNREQAALRYASNGSRLRILNNLK